MDDVILFGMAKEERKKGKRPALLVEIHICIDGIFKVVHCQPQIAADFAWFKSRCDAIAIITGREGQVAQNEIRISNV